MDRPLSVLLVEDEPAECKEFVDYIETIEDVRLVEVTNNAQRALELVKDHLPDAVILDLELHKGGGNGLSFLSALERSPCTVRPYILVTTNNVSPITHQQARQWGADFVLVKSQSDYSAESAVNFLRDLKPIIHGAQKRTVNSDDPGSPADDKKRMFTRVSAEINLVGISPKAVGRDYLVDAILMIIDGRNNSYISSIAQKYGKTDASVERAMQNAIDRAWRSADIDDLQKYYTARVNSSKGIPTLTEFIFYYANKMKT